MFERFTDRARRVIVLAQEEARTLQHNYIGTEHLLLGLIREGEGVAAKALASKGVELDATRKQVEEMIGKGNAAPNGHIPFTPHAKQVLEFSLREALQLGHSYIGTEHILLGLIREGEGVGTQVLINLAKPEFKNMKKAAAGNSVAGGYPSCTICHENEGFAGRDKRTLRTVPVTLGGEPWFWQFSPYGYFHQHGICVNTEHTPMHVDRDTFGHLLDFVDRFPGYFLGCNAALPRIGGSVLAHDHYQGGGEHLPMHKAAAWATFHMNGYPDAVVEILDWPGTAVRVVSRNRDAIVEISDMIRLAWQQFDDSAANIASHDADGNRQSAVSPSAIITDRGYEMSLIFRNNAVSSEYPEGVFHAHPEFWPIKQEPIGLIEAQGLFILPGRLVDQLAQLENALAEGQPLPASVSEFTLEWDELTAALNGNRDRAAIHQAVHEELGSVCERILGNTAVFKTKEQTVAFLAELGLTRQ